VEVWFHVKCGNENPWLPVSKGIGHSSSGPLAPCCFEIESRRAQHEELRADSLLTGSTGFISTFDGGNHTSTPLSRLLFWS